MIEAPITSFSALAVDVEPASCAPATPEAKSIRQVNTSAVAAGRPDRGFDGKYPLTGGDSTPLQDLAPPGTTHLYAPLLPALLYPKNAAGDLHEGETDVVPFLADRFLKTNDDGACHPEEDQLPRC